MILIRIVSILICLTIGAIVGTVAITSIEVGLREYPKRGYWLPITFGGILLCLYTYLLARLNFCFPKFGHKRP